MVGIAAGGTTAAVPITHVVRRQIQIVGSYGAKARRDVPEILKLIERGQVKLEGVVSKRFKLEDAEQAYKELEQGKIVGRAIIDMEL